MIILSTLKLIDVISIAELQIIGESAKALRGVFKQTHENAENCLRTNYFGVRQLTTELLPLLQLSDSPKIVNVSSSFGELKV